MLKSDVLLWQGFRFPSGSLADDTLDEVCQQLDATHSVEEGSTVLRFRKDVTENQRVQDILPSLVTRLPNGIAVTWEGRRVIEQSVRDTTQIRQSEVPPESGVSTSAMILMYREGKSVEAIAFEVGLPQGTVAQRLVKAGILRAA